MSRLFGTLGSLPSLEGFYSSKASLTQLPDLPPDTIIRPTPLPDNQWTQMEMKGRLPKVDSGSSLDSLVLDDTVQFCVPNVPDLLLGDTLKSTNTSLENLKELLNLPKLESGVTLAKSESTAETAPRPYPPDVRKAKIARYKQKLQHRRARVPISRHFAGRSNVAKCKQRVNGKFTKT